MNEHNPILLLIDGNNLAHFLYPDLLGKMKMTENFSQRLIDQLDHFALQSAGRISIELCLDRAPTISIKPRLYLRIFAAEYPQTADDVLIDRYWYHHHLKKPCLVITNDEDILEEVKTTGGNYLRVSDYVRRPEIVNPIFRDPDEFTRFIRWYKDQNEEENFQSLRSSIYFRITKDQCNQSELSSLGQNWSSVELTSSHLTSPASTSPLVDTREISQTHPHETAIPDIFENEVPTLNQFLKNPDAKPMVLDPAYKIDLDCWPLAEGIQFLKNSFCPKHRKEYHDLFSIFNDEDLKPADVRSVAELLLYSCGQEADFSRRGSTMDRVRLALLNSRGSQLTINDISRMTGLKPTGLQGKIKRKTGNWVIPT